jgi:hypothetical protein
MRSPQPPPPFAALSELEAGQNKKKYGVFVRFSTRGVPKHHQFFFGKSTCQKLFAKKLRGEELFSCHSPPSIFF